MVEEAAIARPVRLAALGGVAEEAQGRKGTRDGILPAHIAAFDRYRVTGEGETGRGDAGRPALGGLVADQPVDRARLTQAIPESLPPPGFQLLSSERRRVGKPCVSHGTTRW